MSVDQLLKDFLYLSHYAGTRLDWVQAGGGNTAVKIEDQLWVKASGWSLTQLSTEAGFARLNLPHLLQLFIAPTLWDLKEKTAREHYANDHLQACNLTPAVKPSIESYFHAFLNRFTLHIHPPLLTKAIGTQALAQALLAFADKAQLLTIDYYTPGIELAQACYPLHQQFKQQNELQACIILMKNHGVLVSANTVQTVLQLTEQLTTCLPQTQSSFLQVYQARQIRVGQLMRQLSAHCGEFKAVYAVEDQLLNKLIQMDCLPAVPITPDDFVYLGHGPLVLQAADDLISALHAYQARYQQAPKVLIEDGQIYIIASRLDKAKATADVLKAHLLLKYQSKIDKLSEQEIAYLTNWEAEKHRQRCYQGG